VLVFYPLIDICSINVDRIWQVITSKA